MAQEITNEDWDKLVFKTPKEQEAEKQAESKIKIWPFVAGAGALATKGGCLLGNKKASVKNTGFY